MGAGKEIQDIFVELPQDRGCPCAGKCEQNLHWKRDLSDKFLGMPDRGTIEIREDNSTQEMSWNIQRRK